MTPTHAERRAAYEAKRRTVTNIQTAPLRTFRIVLDGDERVERFASIVHAAQAYPAAVMISDVELVGGFY